MAINPKNLPLKKLVENDDWLHDTLIKGMKEKKKGEMVCNMGERYAFL